MNDAPKSEKNHAQFYLLQFVQFVSWFVCLRMWAFSAGEKKERRIWCENIEFPVLENNEFLLQILGCLHKIKMGIEHDG